MRRPHRQLSARRTTNNPAGKRTFGGATVAMVEASSHRTLKLTKFDSRRAANDLRT